MKRRPNVRKPAILGVGTVAAILLATAPSATAETFKVEIKGLLFSPADISAHVGDTIEWTNQDFVIHSATARDHQWDVLLSAHGVGRLTLDKPGLIKYYCRFHPNMTGSIEIK
ncbi:MAG: cupredoxin domain-containing protein [Alphaproteobacteria bacterium]